MRSRMEAFWRERERERGKRRLHIYDSIISLENLLASWREFLNGKRKRRDIAEFSVNFFDNILALRDELSARQYRHGGYEAFKINDPKPRDIHKASVRDRLMHHAIHKILYPYFDRQFIYDSYSCRVGKGTHRAIDRFREFGRKVSRNGTRTCWVLKCDIRKFFASIDHAVLKDILASHIKDKDALGLLSGVIDSFAKGLPLGNLTSQLLVNVYMNEFDHFVKRELKCRYYIRYADDFVFFSQDRKELEKLLPQISDFLETKLRLALHPDKVYIKTLASGVDFLGWVHFPDHRVLRTATKRRMFKRMGKAAGEGTQASYKGMLRHGNTYKLRKAADLG